MMHDTGVKDFYFIVCPCKDVFELLAQIDKISPFFISVIDLKVDEMRILFSAQVDKFKVERWNMDLTIGILFEIVLQVIKFL